MGSYPCPKCKEPVEKPSGKCWRCGWNTNNYEEDMNACKPEAVWITTPSIQIVEPPNKKLTGLSSSYYELPEGCKELQDLIEYKNMNFARGNIFKATYRLGDKPGTDQIYDYEKIIWFAQREIERLKNAQNTTD